MSKFGSLFAGMIQRGTVPPQVLFGTAAPLPAAAAPPPEPIVLPTPAPAPVVPPPAPAVVAPVVTAPARRAITVRLDPALHRQLRLSCVELDKTAQGLMVEALTRYLDQAELPAELLAGPS